MFEIDGVLCVLCVMLRNLIFAVLNAVFTCIAW